MRHLMLCFDTELMLLVDDDPCTTHGSGHAHKFQMYLQMYDKTHCSTFLKPLHSIDSDRMSMGY